MCIWFACPFLIFQLGLLAVPLERYLERGTLFYVAETASPKPKWRCGDRADMSKIFDNIEAKFEEGLHAILTNVGVERADFCVGYFNLRGWKQVAIDIDKLPSGGR